MPDPDPDAVPDVDVAAAVDALARVAGDWMARPGVVSVEVARRGDSGVGIRVTVHERRPPDGVPADERFPAELDGIPVDVVEGRPPRIEH